METRLAKIEAVLMFEDSDFEAQTGIKKEEDDSVTDASKEITDVTASFTQSNDKSGTQDESQKDAEDEDDRLELTEQERIEQNLLKVDEEWRDHYRASQSLPDDLKEELFSPVYKWNTWQKTKDYHI